MHMKARRGVAFGRDRPTVHLHLRVLLMAFTTVSAAVSIILLPIKEMLEGEREQMWIPVALLGVGRTVGQTARPPQVSGVWHKNIQTFTSTNKVSNLC